MTILDVDLKLPSQSPDGEFVNFQQWVNNAASWIGGTNSLCADAKGRICECGADMMFARDQDAFPVRFWYGEGSQTETQKRKSIRNTKRIIGDFRFRVRESI